MLYLLPLVAMLAYQEIYSTRISFNASTEEKLIGCAVLLSTSVTYLIWSLSKSIQDFFLIVSTLTSTLFQFYMLYKPVADVYLVELFTKSNIKIPKALEIYLVDWSFPQHFAILYVCITNLITWRHIVMSRKIGFQKVKLIVWQSRWNSSILKSKRTKFNHSNFFFLENLLIYRCAFFHDNLLYTLLCDQQTMSDIPHCASAWCHSRDRNIWLQWRYIIKRLLKMIFLILAAEKKLMAHSNCPLKCHT